MSTNFTLTPAENIHFHILLRRNCFGGNRLLAAMKYAINVMNPGSYMNESSLFNIRCVRERCFVLHRE